MSDRLAAALASLDVFLPTLSTLPENPDRSRLLEDAEALRRAVAAFHMEAIRFRMHSVDRLLGILGADASVRQKFDDVRHALEAAGFHTRSHAAPN